jgi:serine/threonine protein kinase
MPSNNENILIQSKMGTPGYKAPEIELGPYSPYLSDIYSLGVVFYEMLFGKKNILKDEGKIIFPKSP